MRTTRWTTVLAVVGALLTATPPSVLAQTRERPRSAPSQTQREELQRRLQDRFGQIVGRQLGLDASEERALAESLREGAEARRELMRRERALRARIAAGVSLVQRGEPAPLMPDDEARAIVREMRVLREEELRLRNAEEARLLEVLTPAQLLRFYALRDLLSQRVRRLEGGAGPGARRGGAGEGRGGSGHLRRR